MYQSIQQWILRQLPQWLRLSRAIDRCNDWLGRGICWLVMVMLVVGSWNVVGRYLGRMIGQNLTSNTSIEVQWHLFDLVFMLGAAYTLQRDNHVRVDVFYKNWSPRGQALANLIGTVCFLIPFSVLVIIATWQWTINSWSVGELSPDPGGLPRFPIKSLIIISFSILIIQGISEAIKHLAIVVGLVIPNQSMTIQQSEMTAITSGDSGNSGDRDGGL
ncbi:MAG: TRAP transporter small permease subunit [Oscillatoriales cyanobacterium]|nr:MAG: TRAP transporter small permease subunit [Oscillatoriales cyanobacterium]